ncbi:hypothetical protein GX408_05270 [bacterium]|nr:hypothetical protein [bacterium]
MIRSAFIGRANQNVALITFQQLQNMRMTTLMVMIMLMAKVSLGPGWIRVETSRAGGAVSIGLTHQTWIE